MNKDNRKKKRTKLEIFVDIIGILGFCLSIFNYYETRIADRKEQILILDVYRENYIFDGESLTRDMSIVIANNSYMAVSITNIDIEYNGITYKFNSNNCEYLPMNLESNNTNICKVVLNININEDQLLTIKEQYNELVELTETDIRKYIDVNRSENSVMITTARNNNSIYTWRIGRAGRLSGNGAGGKI